MLFAATPTPPPPLLRPCRQLSKIRFDFQALAETTVIMLHLEVRCHCFYYLQPALHKVSHSVLCLLHLLVHRLNHSISLISISISYPCVIVPLHQFVLYFY